MGLAPLHETDPSLAHSIAAQLDRGLSQVIQDWDGMEQAQARFGLVTMISLGSSQVLLPLFAPRARLLRGAAGLAVSVFGASSLALSVLTYLHRIADHNRWQDWFGMLASGLSLGSLGCGLQRITGVMGQGERLLTFGGFIADGSEILTGIYNETTESGDNFGTVLANNLLRITLSLYFNLNPTTCSEMTALFEGVPASPRAVTPEGYCLASSLGEQSGGASVRGKAVRSARNDLLQLLSGEAPLNPLDLPPDGFSPAQKELRNLINSRTDEFEEIMTRLTKRELEALSEEVNSGTIRLSEPQKTRLQALADFVKNDPRDSLWLNPGRSWQTVTTFHPAWAATSSEGRLGGTLAGVDTWALMEIEKEIVQRAVKGFRDVGSRIGQGGLLRRFFCPVYHPTKKVLGFNNTMRTRLDSLEEVENLLSAATNRFSAETFDREEVEAIRTAYKALQLKAKAVRKDLEAVYRQDISTGGVQGTDDLHIYAMAKRVEAGKYLEHEYQGEIVQEAEKLADAVESAFQSARKRGGRPPRTVEEYFDPELKIRHRQRGRETDEALARRREFLERDSDLTTRINYEWEETRTRLVTKRDAKGNSYLSTETYTVTCNGTKTIGLTFEDIIERRLQLVGDSTNSPGSGGRITHVYDNHGIVKETKLVAEIENGRRAAFDKERVLLEQFVEGHEAAVTRGKTDTPFKQARLREMTEVEERLSKLREKALHYAEKETLEIGQCWRNDDVDVFRGRNRNMAAAIDRLLERVKICREQFRRGQYELVITPELPDHSEALGILSLRNIFYRTIQVLGGLGIAGVSATPLYWENLEPDNPLRENYLKLRSKVRELRGLPDDLDPYDYGRGYRTPWSDPPGSRW